MDNKNIKNDSTKFRLHWFVIELKMKNHSQFIIYIFILFFPAPEIQLFSNCNILSDMFSLGMVICSIFNQGRPLISANNSTSTYARQLEVVRFYGLFYKIKLK